MKVLFLSTWFPYPPDNGSKTRAYHLLRALAKTHDVSLLSFVFDNAAPESAGELHQFCTNVQAVHRNPYNENRTSSLKRIFSLEPVVTRPIPAMRQLVQATLEGNAFDVVIASTEIMATYALQTSFKVIRVLEEHNSLTRWMWERYSERSAVFQKIRYWASWQKTRRFEARLFSQFDLVTMVSEQDLRFTQDTLPGYRGIADVVPNGVDYQHKHPHLAQPEPNTLIYNGALTYSANYDAMRYFLGEVYPLIKQQVPDVSLTITGSTAGVDLSNLAIDGSVRLSGYVDDIRIPVSQASVCVAPIRQGGGTRLKILEAMALGTPVVATSKAAEGLEVTPNQDILIADAPAEFATQVVRLLRDPGLTQRLATNARRLVERRYDWTRIGQHFVNLVEDVASKRVSGGIL